MGENGQRKKGGMFMKKTNYGICLTAFVFFTFFMMTPSAQAIHKDELKAEIKEELKEELKELRGPLAEILGRILFSGYIEFGGAWQDVEYTDATSVDESDLALTTVELTAEAEVNEWVNVEATLLYEDATSFEGENDETSVDLDVAILTIGNTEAYPLYFSAGVLYVPFGALLTHFPDDPLIDQPLTLLMGETREKAALLGLEHGDFSLAGYVFNGDVDEAGEENQIESYGFDANYSFEDEAGFDILVGASYISNIADSDGLEDVGTVQDYVDGFDAYLHIGYTGFFLDAEYMTALDEFATAEISTGAGGAEGARPAVWNVEFGHNFDWGKGLEVVLKYAGSDESEALNQAVDAEVGFPEERYGICVNKVIFDSVTASLAYLHDEYKDTDVLSRDERDVVFGQIAVEF
jgi:hypothetical protein